MTQRNLRFLLSEIIKTVLLKRRTVTELTFFPWSQDGERPVPADYQPRLLSLHTHVDIIIPEDEDSANKQKTRPDTSLCRFKVHCL